MVARKSVSLKTVALLSTTLLLSACDKSFQFAEVFKTCEPPNSSARFGQNPGPIITSPAAGTPFNGTMTLSGTCVDAMNVTISGTGVAAQVTTMCTGGTFSTSVTFASGDGQKEVDVTQSSLPTQDVTDRQCFNLDTVPPAVNIAGTSGSLSLNQQTVNLVGTCESGLNVIVSGPNLSSSVTTSCVGGRFNAPVTFTGPDGLKNVVAAQVDPAGNNGNDNQNYMIDTTAPVVTITSPAANFLTQNSVTLTGLCENGFPVVITGPGVSGVTTATCNAGAFSQSVVLSAGDGLKNVQASQSDAAGNRGSDSRDFSKDSTTPVVRITAPAANTWSTGTVALVGTCESGLNVNLGGAGIAAPMVVNCLGSAFSVTISLAIPDGLKNIVASQTDLAGNTGNDNRNFNLDSAAPNVTITAPAANAIVQTSVTLTGSCENGLNVQISGAGVAASQAVMCANNSYSASVALSAGDGNKTVQVQQTDLANNVGSASRIFMRDQTAPIVAITSPASNSYVMGSANILGTCENGLSVVLTGDLTAPLTVPCAAGTFSGLVTFSSTDGSKVVRATQTDLASNTSFDQETYIKDTLAPIVTITAPAANSIYASGLTLVGACETGLPVNIGGAGALATSTACTAGTYSVAVTFTVVDGAKTITATQTDAANNVGSATRNFIRDSSVPALAILSPAVNFAAMTGVTLMGSCEVGLTVNISGTGVSAPSTTTCPSGSFTTAINFSPGDGTKNIIATQTDLAGNTANDNRNFVRDNTAPIVTITAPAANSIYQSGLTLIGNCEAGLTVNLSGAGLGGPATTTCAAGTFSVAITLSAGDGNKMIVASQTDGAGNTGNDNRTFVRDSLGPNIAITAPAANSVYQSGLTLLGTCEIGYPVTIAGAGAAASQNVTCTAGAFTANVLFSAGDGTKNLTASQTDLAGNTNSDARSFVRDTLAPAVTISSPAAGYQSMIGLTLVGACEMGLPVNIAGAGIQSPISAVCVGGGYSQAITFSAGDGVKTVTATQTDLAGNIGTASRDFVRDNTSPVVTINAPAANTVGQSGLTISGVCEAGINVALSGTGLATPSTILCSGAGTFSVAILFTAVDGVKNIIATQVDGAGNTGSDNRNFVRDSVGPNVAITAPAANAYITSAFNLQGDCENGYAVNISGAGVANAGTATCTANRFSYSVSASAGDGNKVVLASQTDAGGNVGSDSRTFILDTTDPVITIVAPAANTVAQNGLTLSGACENGLPIALGGTGLASPSSATCVAGSYSVAVLFSVGDGAKLITASQTDGAGNVGTDSRNFLRDSTAPLVAITAPAANTIGATGITLVGSCETGLLVNLSGTGLQSPASTACAAGSFSVAILFSAVDGNKTITASQTDLAGNTGSDSRIFIRDSGAPLVTIASPAANTSTQGALTVAGACEAGLSVVIAGAGIATPTTVACIANSYTASINLSAGDGVKNITAIQTDLAGNIGTDNQNFVRDNTLPIVTIALPLPLAYVGPSANISGSCETGLSVVLSSGIVSPVTVPCAAGAYSATVIFTAGDGTKNVVATQTDLAGNMGSDNRNFVRDGTAPLVLITAPAANTVYQSGLTLSGTCENGLTVTVAGAGVSPAATTSCAGGVFSVAINLSAGDGNKTITAAQTDLAGNTGSDSRVFVRDGTAPVVTINSPAANAVAISGLTIAGNCENGYAVSLSGTGILSPVVATCSGGTYSQAITFSAGDGAKAIVASQTDTAGNVGTATRSFVRDSTVPVILITGPAVGTTANSGLTVVGTCEAGLAVNISGAGVASPVSGTCATGSFAIAINFSAGDGNKVVMASQTDAAGNVGSNSRPFTRDSLSPVILFTAPAAGTIAQNGLTISGTCENGLVVDISGTGVAAASTTNCTGGTFMSAITFSAGDGSKLVQVSQTDGAGNVGSDTRNFLRDTTGPAIFITAPAAMTTAMTGLTVSGTCEAGLTVNISGTGVAAPSTTTCTTGFFSAAITFSAVDGVKPVTVSQTDSVGNSGSDSRSFQRSSIQNGTYNFTSQGPGGMVDILFVDDNSSSMEAEQVALGNRFSSFATNLAALDWQVGITTTDCSTGPYGICGTLLPMAGTASNILTSATTNYLTVFQNTIQRPETYNWLSGTSCLITGTCPSGNEQGLLAAMTAMDKRNVENNGFFRSGADLALVFLSDEDERSNGPASATTAAQVVSHFASIWPTGKKFVSYGIIIQPGDTTCLATQQAQFGGSGFYGNRVNDLANQTTGMTVSICAPDYSLTLAQIANDVTRISRSVDLPNTPIAGSVNITFVPAAPAITWTVSGNRVTLSAMPPFGTQVTIDYQF